MTHNINPHRSGNHPEFKQVYNNADMFYDKLSVGKTELPRKVKEEYRLSQKQLQEVMARNQLTMAPKRTESKHLDKVDLVNTERFASRADSEVSEEVVE